jgi:RimJ/RimL family protein N-acetyltransferase
MAAFTAVDPEDREAFDSHWARILTSASTINRTILFGRAIAGHIAKFDDLGKPEICYWIERELWGRGIATQALAAFLIDVPARPLFARVAKDNIASIRVLQNNGFKHFGEGTGFANARREEVEEFIFTLEGRL